MSQDKSLPRNIFRDTLVSIFIYALPIILLWGWFYYKGEKPWLNKTKTVENTAASKE